MSSEAKDVEKCVEVEAVAEGPRVRAKRQMTPAQLENLRRGRERLAEKRKQQKLEKIQEISEESLNSNEDGKEQLEHDEDKDETSSVENEDESNMVSSELKEMICQDDDNVYPASYCSLM
jgi:hypothetical protein